MTSGLSKWKPTHPMWLWGLSCPCSPLLTYFSKSLSSVEWNYEIHNKEMLAIIRALEEWKHFLQGVHSWVEIWMDHKNLEYFCTSC